MAQTLTKLKLNGQNYDLRDAESYNLITTTDSNVVGSVQYQIKLALANLDKESFKVVDQLPEADKADFGIIYLIKEPTTLVDYYTEYIRVTDIEGNPYLEKIGTTSLDLSNYIAIDKSIDISKAILAANGFIETSDTSVSNGYVYVSIDKETGLLETSLISKSTYIAFKKEIVVKTSQLDELKSKTNEAIDSIHKRITLESDALNKQTNIVSHLTIDSDTIVVNDVEVLRPKLKPVIDWYDLEATELVVDSVESFLGLASLLSKGVTFENQTVLLTNSLDLAGQDIEPIGYATIPSNELIYFTTNYGKNVFKGTFDGQGNTISNLRITNYDKKHCVGLFGIIEPGASIKNLTLENVYIDTSASMVGSVVGYIPKTDTVKETQIRNITVRNTEISGNYGVGAIVGRCEAGNSYVVITNCTVENTNVSAKYKNAFAGVGAIAGALYGNGSDNIVSECIVKNVTISSANEGNGGLVGHFERGLISNNLLNNVTVSNTIDTRIYMQEAVAVGALAGTIDSTITTTSTNARISLLNNTILKTTIEIPASYTNTGNATGVQLDENGYPDWEIWPLIGTPRREESRDPTNLVNYDNIPEIIVKRGLIHDNNKYNF